MTNYNYRMAMLKDVEDYIDNEINLEEWKGNRDGLAEHLNDVLWCEDSVTGNASGSYTFNTYQAEEYICHNLDILADALDEWGIDENPFKKGAEWCDVTIRCYLLSEIIEMTLDGLEEEGAFEEEEEEE